MSIAAILAIIISLAFYGVISPTASMFGPTTSRGVVRNDKLVALTFDDGPYGDATNKILDILKEKNVKAAFFVIGRNASEYPDILRREVAEGHIIGNHSSNHSKFLAFETPGAVKHNVQTADASIFSSAGLHPRFFRFPGGLKSPQAIGVLEGAGYSIVLWNDMTDDYDLDRSPQQITANILKRLKPGAIIVLHDGRDTRKNYPRTNVIEALPTIIDKIRESGYTFVTLDKLIGQKPYF